MDSLQFSVWANPCYAEVVTTVLTLPLETAIDTPTVCLEVEPSGRGLDSVFTIDQYSGCSFSKLFLLSTSIRTVQSLETTAIFSVLSLSIYTPTAICLLVQS
jgi:hypothetical protein